MTEPELQSSGALGEAVSSSKEREGDEDSRLAAAERLEKARKQQELEARRIRKLETWANDKDYFEHPWNFARLAAQISKHYLRDARATGKNPSSHSISFGSRRGETMSATLAQVYALLPQHFQWMVEDVNVDQDVPQFSADWNASWLDENIMNVIVHIECPEKSEGTTVFGLGVASNINQTMDELYKEEFGASYLQHMVSKMLNNPDEYKHEAKTYTFPADTKRIVYFWNYSASHWTVVVTDISEKEWRHYIYNSMGKGSEWGQLNQFGGDIELLIQTLSGMPKPKYSLIERLSIYYGESAAQDNTDDCGVFSIYNAVMTLKGRDPLLDVSGLQLRHHAMCKILAELEWMFGALPEENEENEENNDISSENGPSGTADAVQESKGSDIGEDIFYDASSSILD